MLPLYNPTITTFSFYEISNAVTLYVNGSNSVLRSPVYVEYILIPEYILHANIS